MSEIGPDSLDAAVPGNTTSDERTWGMLSHLTAFCGFLLPLGSLLGPLLVWMLKRDQSAFVMDQGREALNFNISVLLAALLCWVLVFIWIGILLFVVLGVAWMALTILAAIKAYEGVRYRYPFALRLLK